MYNGGYTNEREIMPKLERIDLWIWDKSIQEYKSQRSIGWGEVDSIQISDNVDSVEIFVGQKNDDQIIIEEWQKEKETFLNDKNVEIYHSGGGCVHYYLKGFLIDSQNHEILHEVEKYRLETECYFGYWDGEKQFGFSATLKEGVELLEMLDYKELREV